MKKWIFAFVVGLLPVVAFSMAKKPDESVRTDWNKECSARGYMPAFNAQRASGNILLVGGTGGLNGYWIEGSYFKHPKYGLSTPMAGESVYQKPFSYSKCTYLGTAVRVTNGQLYYLPAAGFTGDIPCPERVRRDYRYNR